MPNNCVSPLRDSARSAAAPDLPPGIGVIGAGPWGQNLIRNLRQLGALGAVADISPHLRQKVRADYPEIPYHADYHSILDSSLPAVAIATPARTHYEIVRATLLADKDVFVEKPLALDPAQADELCRLAHSRRRVLMVGHLVLFQPATSWIRNFLADGALGAIRSIHQERLNLGRVRDFENVLWCLGSHDVAVQLYLLGQQPNTLRAQGQPALQKDIEDDVYLHMEYGDDLHTHLHVSWWWPRRRRRMIVLGSKGMLEYDELRQTVTLHRKMITPGLTARDEGSEIIFRGQPQPLRLEMEHFLDCVIHRKQPIASARDSANVVRILASASDRLRQQRAEPVFLQTSTDTTGEME